MTSSMTIHRKRRISNPDYSSSSGRNRMRFCIRVYLSTPYHAYEFGPARIYDVIVDSVFYD